MISKDTFSSYHPIINFLYFGMVVVFLILFWHPACLIASLVSAVTYSIYLRGRKAVRFGLI